MKKIRWILPLIILYFIFGASLMNGESSGGLSIKIAEFFYFANPIIDLDQFHFFIRKLAHFSEYALLASSICYASAPNNNKSQKIIFIISLFIPIIDESLQLLSDGRACSIYDMLLDASAMIFIYSLYLKSKGDRH